MKITDRNQLSAHDRVELRRGRRRVEGEVEHVGLDAVRLGAGRRRVTAVWLHGHRQPFQFRVFGGWALVSADR